jgi:hypothetical protein
MANSTQPDFDWHRNGVWMALADGAAILDTVANTPHGSRAALLRKVNRRWSALQEAGFVIQSFMPELTPSLRTGQDVVTSNEARYRYPKAGPAHKAPSGQLFLLTEGGITVPGEWKDGAGFIGWHPKVQRDKALEIQLGYRLPATKEAHEPASSDV